METFAIYLLKVSALLSVFWAAYRLLLHKETLFSENRWFLIVGIFTALFLPFFKLQQLVMVEPILISDGLTNTALSMAVADGKEVSLNWAFMFFMVYLLGCGFFLTRFLVQLHSLRRLSAEADSWKEDDLLHIQTKREIEPFSFFKSLFYNPSQFKKQELQVILSHEKVHARDWHSLDVLLGEVLKILLWWNPIIWIYQNAIKQNLEFLADSKAINAVNKKTYQFLMVNQATGKNLALANSFYNPLIKKRIVMLNKTQSKKLNVLKSLVVLPLLALFLVGFNTEKIYDTKNGSMAAEKSIELIINKDTSEDELKRMKSELSADDIDFSYTTVRNDQKEIIDISIQISGKNEDGESFSGNYQSNSEGPIDPLAILYDDEANFISFGNSGKHKRVKIHKSGDHTMVWNGLDEIGEHEDIVIIEKNGKKKIMVNGKEVDEDELNEMDFNISIDSDDDDSDVKIHVISDDDHKNKKKVKVRKHKSKSGSEVMIIKDSDDEHDIEVLSGDEGFFFIDTDGGAEPLYILDGKEVSRKVIKKLSPKEIMTVNVLKGEVANTKYGPKAKNGVVEITSKKKN